MAFDGSNIWIGSDTEGRITRLHAADGSPNGTFTAPGGSLAFDGQNVWTSGGDLLWVLAASDGEVIAKYPIVSGVILFDGSYIWAAGLGGLQKVDPSDGTVVLFASLDGRGAYGLIFDGENVWAAQTDYSSVTKVRASDGTVEGTFVVGAYPLGLAFDGANVWVANTGTTLMKLRASDGALLGTFSIPASYLAFDGKDLWASDTVGNVVRRIRPRDGFVEHVYRVGSAPEGILYDGSAVWVADFYDSAVNKISRP